MKKILVIVTALTVFAFAAGSAQAALTESQITSILSLLDSFGVDSTTKTNVEASLRGTTTTTTTTTAGACSFTRNLYLGVSGTDVTCLQNYLIGRGHSIPAGATGYFGSQTQAAVIAWQTANGVSPAAGYFGSISRAKYASVAGTGTGSGTGSGTGTTGTCAVPTGGLEGALVATIASTPASGQEVFVSQTGKGIAGVDVKATGSDILVSRLTINFSARPWLYFNNITVTDGTTSKSMAVTSANSIEVTVGSSYDLLIDGLCFYVPKDTTKTLTVKIDGVSALPSGETSKEFTLTFAANAVRGVDGKNINEYAPASALSTRTFTVKAGDTSNIELTANADNPKGRSIVTLSTGVTTGVVLAKLNLKGTNRDSYLRNLILTDANASGTGGTIQALYLYDGDTLISSTSSIASTASTTHFTNINLTIPKDTTKVLTIKGDIAKAQGNYVTAATGTNASTSLAIEANAYAVDAEDSVTYGETSITGSSVTAGAGYFYLKAPTLALNSATISSVAVATGTVTYNGKADARIRINVTANGGDIYISSTTSDVGATNTIAASATQVSSVTSNGETSAAGNFIIRAGDTKWVEYYSQLTRADDGNSSTVGDLSTYVYLTPLSWYTADFSDNGDNVVQDWGLDDFKTGSVVLEYFR